MDSKVPHSINISLTNGQVKRFIMKGSFLPITMSFNLFTTSLNFQDITLTSIYEGESEYESGNKLIGQLKVSDFPRKPKGEVRFRTILTIDENGKLSAKVFEFGHYPPLIAFIS